MAFWGIEVKPGKPFTHRFDESKGRLHVSMASLGLGNAIIKSVLQCNVGNKSPVFLCSLYPEKSESLQLNLEFEEVDEVILSVIGPRSIHLSGYYLSGGRFRTLTEESESYGEDIAGTDSQRSDHSDEEYDGSFINDDEPEVFSPSPISSEDESWDDKKPRNKKGNLKRRLKKAYQVSESEEEDRSRPKNNINGSYAVPVVVSEDEDNCTISTLLKNGINSKKDIPNGGENANKAMDETPKKSTKDDTTELKKQNTDDSTADGHPIRQSDLPVGPLPNSEDGHNNGVAPKKKRKERSESDKVKGETTQEVEAKVDSITEDQQTPKITEDSEAADKNDERPKKKKKGESKNEKKVFDVKSSNPTNDVKESKEKQNEAKVEQNEAKEEKESEEKKVKKKKKKKEVHTLQNGIVIEELQSGKPEANVAVSGKKISIRFIGKLKNTEQVFDSNIENDDPFKFRLGAKEVIKGWDIGLEGMRVGEKRRLTIPPKMGFGRKGDGKSVPGDSWLVYEVELVKVR